MADEPLSVSRGYSHNPPTQFATERRVRKGWTEYRAVCRCGFKGRWTTLNEAQGEFRSHRREATDGRFG